VLELAFDNSTKMHFQPIIDNVSGNSCLRLQFQKLRRCDRSRIEPLITACVTVTAPSILACSLSTSVLDSSPSARTLPITSPSTLKAATKIDVAHDAGTRSDEAVYPIAGLSRFFAEHGFAPHI
jgi:hypothetical protein